MRTAREQASDPQAHPEAEHAPGALQLMEEYRDYAERVVHGLCRAMRIPNQLHEDLLAAGYLGLVEAATRYETSYGIEFPHYARLRIRGAVVDEIRRSVGLSGKYYRFLRAYEELLSLRQSEVMDGESVQRRESRRSTHSETMNASTPRRGSQVSRSRTRKESLEEVLHNLSQGAIVHQLIVDGGLSEGGVDTVCRSPEQAYLSRERSDSIRRYVRLLPEKERYIIEQHYFHDRVFAEIAGDEGKFTKSWISRVHRKAIHRLRTIVLQSKEGEDVRTEE